VCVHQYTHDSLTTLLGCSRNVSFKREVILPILRTVAHVQNIHYYFIIIIRSSHTPHSKPHTHTHTHTHTHANAHTQSRTHACTHTHTHHTHTHGHGHGQRHRQTDRDIDTDIEKDTDTDTDTDTRCAGVQFLYLCRLISTVIHCSISRLASSASRSLRTAGAR
jgi:hypothetical protein